MKVAEPKPDKKAIYEAAVRAGMDEPTADATTAEEEGGAEEGRCRGCPPPRPRLPRRPRRGRRGAAAEARPPAPAETPAE